MLFWPVSPMNFLGLTISELALLTISGHNVGFYGIFSLISLTKMSKIDSITGTSYRQNLPIVLYIWKKFNSFIQLPVSFGIKNEKQSEYGDSIGLSQPSDIARFDNQIWQKVIHSNSIHFCDLLPHNLLPWFADILIFIANTRWEMFDVYEANLANALIAAAYDPISQLQRLKHRRWLPPSLLTKKQNEGRGLCSG